MFELVVHFPSLIHHRNSQCRGFDIDDEYGHDRKERHRYRQEDGGDDKHLRAHPLEIFAFDDCQKLFHADSVTFVMKMSLRLGSIISNFPITAPESIKRFSSVWAFAPGASSACASSACRTTLLTSSGSSSTPSPPSQR